MKLESGCLPCIVNQSYIASRMLGIINPEIQKKIIKETMSALLEFDYNHASPYFSTKLQSIVCKYSRGKNLYKKIKKNNYVIVKKFVPILERMIGNAKDKLETAVRLAIIGNTIDIGANPVFNLEKEIENIYTNVNMDNFKNFKTEFQKAKTILYIADNFEEALFDKFLIEQLYPKEVVFAVRSKEILNDITIKDCKFLRIDRLCRVIESGSEITGTDLQNANSEFKKLFKNSDLIISKGQGNLETLFEVKRRIYFMFKVKCEVISKKTGYPLGSGVIFINK